MNIRLFLLLGLCFGVGPLQADDTITFTDDFESGAERWEPLNQEKKQTWRVEKSDKGQSFHQFAHAGTYPGKHRAPMNLALLKDARVTDFTFEADVKKFKKGGHQDVCFAFGYQDGNNFYYIHFGSKVDGTSGRILKVKDSPRKSFDQPLNKETPWNPGQWHHIKVVRDAKAGTITAWFDDMTKPHMQATDKDFTWGQIGIGSFDDTSLWDNIKLTATVYTASKDK